jgi:NAD(P)-dependent dehydrogenase (short-subunit alcohol dehydrogenase family)
MKPKKVILLTGGSSGIGRATADLLSRHNYLVFATARDATRAPRLPGVRWLPLDVRDDASVEACVSSVLSQTERIDVLINNAGYTIIGAVEETSPTEAHAIFDTNVFGVLRTVRAMLPAMRRQGSGLIINNSSVLGFLPAPFMGLYASTKHALEGLSETLDHEVREFGIRVVLIEPSFINTQLDEHAVLTSEALEAYALARKEVGAAIVEKMRTAKGPDVVATAILQAIEGRHRTRRPVGFEAHLLSGLRRFMPANPVDRSIRKTFALN